MRASNLIKIEVEEYQRLYDLLCRLQECDKNPTRDNWDKVVQAYTKAMMFYEDK